MRPIAFRSMLIACCLISLIATAATGAGKKTHVAVPARQILNLESDSLLPDNSGGHPFNFDSSGEVFVVPAGFSFVATDVTIRVDTSSPTPTDDYAVVVNFDNGGSRTFVARFLGASFYQHFITGYVMPEGTTPTARNVTDSTHSVVVQIQGYLVKGPGLGQNESF